MSTWRDIWRYGVIANRIFAEDSQKGLMAIRELSKVYGKDGMIHYIYAEALENKNLLEPARKEYQIAKDLFPVAHWKDVAQDSINRINQSKTPEEYFGYKFEIKTNKKGEQEYFIDSNIKIAGYGESRPVASNATEEGRARNRRVTIKIYNRQNSSN